MSLLEASVAPRERVNFTLPRTPGDASTEDELPFKLLLIGDYTQRPNDRPLAERRPVAVDKDSFAQVLADHGLTLHLTVPERLSPGEGRSLSLTLAFKKLADFSPEGIARQAPATRELLEVRSALNAIKGPLGPVPSFKKRMVAALGDPESRQRLRREMGLDGEAPQAAAEGSLVEAFLREAHIEPRIEGYDTCRRGLEAFLAAMMTPPYEGERLSKNIADALIADIDARLSAQVNEVLHHPAFQRLEAAWRTLKFVVDRVDFRENIRLDLLDCSKDDLQLDFEDSPVVSRSGLHQHLYVAPYGTTDGVPYGVAVADFTFSPSSSDVLLLTRCAAVAALAHTPFLAGASPAMVGATSWAEGFDARDLPRHFEAPAYAWWRAFRDGDAARYVGLCAPRFLLRLPYGSSTVPVRWFNFEEDAVGHPERYLWGNAAAALATRVAESFAKYRWGVNMLGTRDGQVDDLPTHAYEVEGEVRDHGPLDARLTERQADALAEAGFIALVSSPAVEATCFPWAASCGRRSAVDAELPYLFVATRLAQHLAVLHRLRGASESAVPQGALQAWLSRYVSDVDDPKPGIRSRRPLREASVTVEAQRETAGPRRFELRLRPHFKHGGAPFTLTLVGTLDP